MEHSNKQEKVYISRRTLAPLLLVLFLVLTSICQADTGPDDRALRAFWKRNIHNALHILFGDDLVSYLGFRPEIRLIDSPLPNAFSLPNREIVVSEGLLRFAQDPSELAFVLAHEVAHQLFDLPSSIPTALPNPDRQGRELRADAWALQALDRSGFDPQAGLRLLKRVEEGVAHKSSGLGGVFPTLEARTRSMTNALASQRFSPQLRVTRTSEDLNIQFSLQNL